MANAGDVIVSKKALLHRIVLLEGEENRLDALFRFIKALDKP